MFKKCQVVLLHTKDKSPLMIDNNSLSPDYLRLMYAKSFGFDQFDHNKNLRHTFKHHLYILSDDEIVDGDYFLYMFGDKSTWEIVIAETKLGNPNDRKNCKKIIATTDTSLTVGRLEHTENCRFPDEKEFVQMPLPQLPQEFIERYVESYNKGKPITDVLVEYESYDISTLTSNTKDFPNLEIQLPKVNQKDNTIDIKVTKDSWTREEVHNLMMQAWIHGQSKPDCHYMVREKWIEENL